MHIRSAKSLVLIILFLRALQSGAQNMTAGTDLWNRVEYLRQSTIPEEKQLEELLLLQKRCIAGKAVTDSAYANLLQRIGALYYKKQHLSDALKYAEESVKVGSLGNGKTNPRYLAKGYYNLAVFYKESKWYPQSMAAFDSSIAYARGDTGFLPFAVLSYLNLSNLFFLKGDYGQSILHADKGALFARRINNPFYEASCLSEKAQALAEINELEQASASIRNSIDIYAREFEKKEPDQAALIILGNLYAIYAHILSKTQKPHRAIEYYTKAFGLYEQTGHRHGCFSALNNIGNVYNEKLFDRKKAKTWYGKAVQFAGNSDDTIVYCMNVSNLFYKEKSYDSSLRYLQYGLRALPMKFNDAVLTSNPALPELANSPNKVLALTLVAKKARIWLNYFRISKNESHAAQALSNYYLADKLVDALRFEQQAGESKLFWRKHTHDLYEEAIEACYLLKKPAEAFYFFEKGRSALLYDQLQDQDWLVKKNQRDLNKQLQLKSDVVKWKRELANTSKDDRRYDELINLVFNGEQDLSKILQNIKNQNPYYYHHFLDSSFITLPYLQQNLLRDHQGIVELFEGDSAVYSFVITREQISFTKINKKEYDTLTASFISFISNEHLLNRKFREFVMVSNRLYRLVFGNSQLAPGRIIVSPGGRYFPFEALVTKFTGDSVTYFLNDHAVSYTYSARYLTKGTEKNAKHPGKSFLGLAPVRYPPGWKLAALTGSDGSLERIREHFDAPAIFLFGKATKKNFMQGLYGHKVIQLYTHASDSGKTGEPVIYLADSVLYLSDLVSGNVPVTDLVTLSACETGSGQVYQGEGVFSFNRGLAAIGIPASVTNLWSVNNRSSYRLTELFYQYLADGIPKDVALQKAKLEFIHSSTRSGQLPFYWAATILAGKTDAIEFQKPVPWKTWVLLAVLAVVIILGIKKVSAHKPGSRLRK